MPHPPRRSGALRPLRALLTLVVAGTVVSLGATVLNLLSGARTPVRFWAPYDALADPLPDVLGPGLTPAADADVAVTVADPSAGQTALETVAGGALAAVFWLVVAVLARRIVTTALHADPFGVPTADRLRRLAAVVLAGGAVTELARAVAAYALYRGAFPGAAYLGPTGGLLDLWWLPLGLAVLAFAAVVRHGCTVRAELDGVV